MKNEKPTAIATMTALLPAKARDTYIKKAAELADQSNAENTIRLYKHDWERFVAFCEVLEMPFMPFVLFEIRVRNNVAT